MVPLPWLAAISAVCCGLGFGSYRAFSKAFVSWFTLCHPRSSDGGLKPGAGRALEKAVALAGETADAGASKSLGSHPLPVRLHCARPHLRSRPDRRGVARGALARVSTSLAWLLIDLRRLFVIVPPGLGDAARVARFARRPAEHVPVGQPVRGLVPVRNPIAAGSDHPIEHLAGRR